MKKLLIMMMAVFSLAACAQKAKTNVISESEALSKLKGNPNVKVATFAGGCFWCTETIFENIKGVKEVISGYAGGKETNPTYETVGAGMTSHAEAFQVYYDPSIISFKDLVRVFFASIDPTIVNGQGPDRGAQYRTIAFYTTDEELAVIDQKMKEVANEYTKPIATQVRKFDTFYQAEDYHQDFVKNNPNQGYVRGESIPRRERTLAKVKDLVKQK
jgi:peptide-methionine (S)-S-oxide reductase